MFLRAFAIWAAILVLAIINGAFREMVLSPRFGGAVGHVASSILLSTAAFVVAMLSIRWIGPTADGEALIVGLEWLLLTLAFEFLAGHYLFGNSWEKLLEDYNVMRRRIWSLVLVVCLFAPVAAYRLRK